MKGTEIKYSGKDKETQEEIVGTVMANFPETIEEAIQDYGAEVCLSKVISAVTIDTQRVARTAHSAKDGDEKIAQAAVDGYKPGVSKPRATGEASEAALLKKLAKLAASDPDKFAAMVAEAKNE